MAELPKVAEEAVKKIDSKLECSICLEAFKEPKLLPCFHIFCKSPCLERLVVQDAEGQTLTCPTCRHHVTLPDNGVAGLQTDFHIGHLFEIRESLEKAKNNDCENCKKSAATKFCQHCKLMMCAECMETHRNWKDFSDHVILEASEIKMDVTDVHTTKRILRCEKHPTKKLKIYCNTCDQLTCSSCAISLHREHNYELVEEAFPRHRETFAHSLEHFKEKLSNVQQALTVFDDRVREIEDQRATTENRIHSEIDQLYQILEQHRAELVLGLNSNVQQKLKELAAQRDLVEITQTKMSSCLEYAEAGLETGSEGEVLRMKGPVLKRIEEITAEFDPDTLQPYTEADIELVIDNKTRKSCQEFGEIAQGPISSKDSYATGSGTKVAMVDTEAVAKVHVTTSRKENYQKKLNLKAKLVNKKTGATINCDVNQENGRHTITYQPLSRGRHHLHIKINGRHIQGSPYSIAVAPSPESLRKPARVVQGLSKPYGVAVNSQGNTVVAERDRQCISKLTLDGKKSFGTRAEFKFPCGVTTDQDDNIYTVDVSYNRIQKFTSDGTFIAAAGKHGSNEMQFNKPSGICYNKTNHLLYVCDQNNSRIQVITTDLTFVRSFGEIGISNGHFNYPLKLAFDSGNNLYVTDCGNNRVQVFTANGQFLKVFADCMVFENPYAIAIDSSDIVYVSESRRNCISLFTAQGEFITSFGVKGKKEGQFNGICGLCIDQDGSIIVSDSANNRLQIL